MKRILSLILAMLMLVSMIGLVACEEMDEEDKATIRQIEQLAGKSPEEIYQTAIEKVKTGNNYRFAGTVTSSGSGVSVDMALIAETDGVNTHLQSVSNSMGVNMIMESWMIGGNMYSRLICSSPYMNSVEELTYKIEMTPEQYERYLNITMPEGADAEDSLIQIPEEWLSSIQFKVENDNSYYLEFDISSQEYKKYYPNIDIEDTKYKVYFDSEGNLNKIWTSGTSMGMTSILDWNVEQIGDVVVTPPDGSENWMPIDAEEIITMMESMLGSIPM